MTKSNSRIIAVSSGKGGVGKTTLTVNLGVALSRLGLGVCLFDADTNLANINIMLRENPPYTLQHLLNGSRKVSDVIVHTHGVSLVAGSAGISQNETQAIAAQQRMEKAFRQLTQMYDVTLVDTAAGIHETVLNFVESAQQSIVVITPEPTSLTDAFTLLRMLRKRQYRQRINVVVCRARSEAMARKVFGRFAAAVSKYIGYKVAYLGYVEEDRLVSSAICRQVPIRVYNSKSAASLSYDVIAKNILKLLEKEEERRIEILSDNKAVNQELDENEASPVIGAVELVKEDYENIYIKEAKTRKKQMIKEHKDSLLEYIAEADVDKRDIKSLINDMNAAYLKRYRESPGHLMEQLGVILQNGGLDQKILLELIDMLTAYGRDRHIMNSKNSNELINQLINDYIDENGQYPFDTGQVLMQSIGMGQVTDEGVRELDTILRLVGSSGKRKKSGQALEMDTRQLQKEIIKEISEVSNQDLSPGDITNTVKQRDLLDSISFASRLINK